MGKLGAGTAQVRRVEYWTIPGIMNIPLHAAVHTFRSGRLVFWLMDPYDVAGRRVEYLRGVLVLDPVAVTTHNNVSTDSEEE